MVSPFTITERDYAGYFFLLLPILLVTIGLEYDNTIESDAKEEQNGNDTKTHPEMDNAG